jgi:hypothetical protein
MGSWQKDATSYSPLPTPHSPLPKKIEAAINLIAASLSVAEMKPAVLFMKPVAALGVFISQQAHRSGHIKSSYCLNSFPPSPACERTSDEKVTYRSQLQLWEFFDHLSNSLL